METPLSSYGDISPVPMGDKDGATAQVEFFTGRYTLRVRRGRFKYIRFHRTSGATGSGTSGVTTYQ